MNTTDYSPGLIATLHHLGEDYGPRGVLEAAHAKWPDVPPIKTGLPIAQCPQGEPHPPHDHSPVSSKHCNGVARFVFPQNPMFYGEGGESITQLIERFSAWLASVGARLTAGESPGDGRTLDEVEPTADGRRVWIPGSDSAEASLDHVEQALRGRHTHRPGTIYCSGPEDELCEVCHPRTDTRMMDIRVHYTGETSWMCDYPDCTNWSTHDVEIMGAVHRSCGVHLREMVTV